MFFIVFETSGGSHLLLLTIIYRTLRRSVYDCFKDLNEKALKFYNVY